MTEKPFYASLTTIILMPMVVFVVNAFLIFFLGMTIIEEHRIDKILHILGGLSISFSAAGVLWNLIQRNLVTLQDKYVSVALVFGFVCFTVISWEILEYIVIDHKHLTYSDTVTDMICGLIGGLFAIPYIRRTMG